MSKTLFTTPRRESLFALPLGCGLVASLLAITAQGVLAEKPRAEDGTPVEHETTTPKRGNSGLGTIQYKPAKQEPPFFEKLAKDERSTGGLAGDYDIATKDDKFVGWFGIVREVAEDKEKRETRLTIEHKYFDGLTDAHILALSFNGSGDFQVALTGVGHKIELLTLVKVYGTVKAGAADEPPRIAAEYVRNWHWGTLTFLGAFGADNGNAAWRKLNRVDLEEIYDPYPDDDYYRQRLGDRSEEEAPAEARRGDVRSIGRRFGLMTRRADQGPLSSAWTLRGLMSV